MSGSDSELSDLPSSPDRPAVAPAKPATSQRPASARDTPSPSPVLVVAPDSPVPAAQPARGKTAKRPGTAARQASVSKRRKTGKGAAGADVEGPLDAGGLTPPPARRMSQGEGDGDGEGLTPPALRDPFAGMDDIFDESSPSPPGRASPRHPGDAAAGPSNAGRRGARRRSGVDGRDDSGGAGEKGDGQGGGGTKSLKITLKVVPPNGSNDATEATDAARGQGEGGSGRRREGGSGRPREMGPKGSKARKKGKARDDAVVELGERVGQADEGDDSDSKQGQTGRGGPNESADGGVAGDKSSSARGEAPEAHESKAAPAQPSQPKRKEPLARKKSSARSAQPVKKRRTARSDSETATDDVSSDPASDPEVEARQRKRPGKPRDGAGPARSRTGAGAREGRKGGEEPMEGAQDGDKGSAESVPLPSATPIGPVAKYASTDSAKKAAPKKRPDGTGSATGTPARPLPGPSTGKSLMSTPDPTTGIMLPRKKKPAPPPRVPAPSLLANTLRMLADDAAKKSATPDGKTNAASKKPLDPDEWILTSAEQAQYDSSKPQRERERAVRAKWKLHAVDLQANKDAYKLDSVLIGKRPIPLHIPGKPVGLRLMPSDVIVAMFGDPEARRRAREEKNRAAWEEKMNAANGQADAPAQQAEADGVARGIEGGGQPSASVVVPNEVGESKENQSVAADPIAL